jgi:N-acetylglucosaminyl-diphospho-decaprenol L-rhamnosyltransferase
VSHCSSKQTCDTDVTVIVVNYNTGHLFERMFSALERAKADLRMQVIVVDNVSRDDSVKILRSKHPTVELIENSENVGFGRANNQALPRVNGRYVLLLNTDAFLSPDTLTKTTQFMDDNPNFGILGVKLVGEDGSLQPSCRYFPTPWNTFLASTGLARVFPHGRLVDDLAWDHSSVRTCDWVPGCYYLVRREVIERVGLFDPRYFLYYEEVDHCREVQKAGWKVVYFPFTEVVHLGGESAKSDAVLTSTGRQISLLQIESELLYFRKHHGLLGVIASVFLSILAASAIAMRRLVQYRETDQALPHLKQAWSTMKLFFETGLASRPTR